MLTIKLRRNFKLHLSLVSLLALPTLAHGEDNSPEGVARCENRVSGILSDFIPEISAKMNPKERVRLKLESSVFIENFSKFLNSQFNDDPGEKPSEDAVYHLARVVLKDKKPFKDLFVGHYDFEIANPGPAEKVTVIEKASGLGYFGTTAWKVRYIGNEMNGVRIQAAYRILNNVTGFKTIPQTNAPGIIPDAKGRANEPCAACHYRNWFALDKTASVLGQAVIASKTFNPPSGEAKQILDGKMIKNERELVEALVASEDFNFASCRLAFKFLYGRPENTCEAKVFDECMQAFRKTGLIQDALSAIINDPSYCH